MIIDFEKGKKKAEDKKKARNLREEAIDLNERSKNLDYGAVAAWLCGEGLDEEQQDAMDEFNSQYDEMRDLDAWR